VWADAITGAPAGLAGVCGAAAAGAGGLAGACDNGASAASKVSPAQTTPKTASVELVFGRIIPIASIRLIPKSDCQNLSFRWMT
jgi:hypothetical protein